MTFSKIFLVLFMGLVLSSCGNPFGSMDSYVDQNYGGGNPAVLWPSPAGVETVAGASFATTSSGRKANLSAGQAASEIKLSTGNSRTIYLNVQGQISE